MNVFKNVSVGILAIAFMFGPLQTTLAAGPARVELGTAGNFVILAKTGIQTTGSTSVVGDIGVSPISATAITGFGLTLPAASAFSTSALVTGKVYAPGYADPTPANLTTAIGDMQTAYTDGMGRASNVTELGAGSIGGLTLVPGVYKWGTGVTIPTDVTLSGGANDVWIFQIAQTLTVSSSARIVLSGGAQPSNIFWVVGGQTTIGTGAVFNGNILGQTAIVLNTGATLNGRALAQAAVTLDSNAVTASTTSVTQPPVVPPTVPPTSDNDSSVTNNESNENSSSSDSSANTDTPVVCSPGQMFNMTTGEKCTSVVNTVFCPPGQMFNGTNGQRCNTIVSPNAPGASGYNFGATVLKVGSKGAAVMELQKFLNAKLNLGLVVDGKLGPKTTAVTKKWQKDNGLVADGIIGVKTKALMQAM